jgi:hypothetical protein
MVFSVYGYFQTMINDVTFGGYHKFGTESRILPDSKRLSRQKLPHPTKHINLWPDLQRPDNLRKSEVRK